MNLSLSQRNNPAKSIPFPNLVHLFADLEPWQMAFAVEGIEINTAGFLGRISKSNFNDISMEEIQDFLKSRQFLTLQLNHPEDSIPIPTAPCKINNLVVDASGILLQLDFTNNLSEIEDFCQDLERR